jgi:AcrR family transcriptional regulator
LVPKVSVEHKAGVRDRLLDAASACLDEVGLEGLTTRAIMERAGVSAGTLYNYFSGKDELVMAVAERVAAVEFVGLRDDVDLVSLVGRLLAPNQDNGVLAELRVRARVDPQVRRALAHYDELTVNRFTPLVEQAQRDGLLSSDIDAAALVELVELVFEALHAHAAAGTFVTSHERVANTFVSTLSNLQRKGVAS